MEKSFIDIFMQLADEQDRIEAKRAAKILEKNQIDSMDILNKIPDSELAEIKGIGTRAMHVISVIKTRDEMKRRKQMGTYKKTKSKSLPKDFHYFAVRCAGKCTSLSAYQFERCLKRGGINTLDDLLNASQEDLSQIKGIGPKRLQQCIEIKSMIFWHRKNNSL